MTAYITHITADADPDEATWRITVARGGDQTGRYYGTPTPNDLPIDVLQALHDFAVRGLNHRGLTGKAQP